MTHEDMHKQQGFTFRDD
uniref:Uncharacterized protein n=1 Tax=Arundo donax TaxID=35708 RepID=A0A0A8ZF53_ARUDO